MDVLVLERKKGEGDSQVFGLDSSIQKGTDSLSSPSTWSRVCTVSAYIYGMKNE